MELFGVDHLMLHEHNIQILETRDTMNCFSAHSGIHGFAPIWHIFLKYVPYGCKTMYAIMCGKTFHDTPTFQNFQLEPRSSTFPFFPILGIISITVHFLRAGILLMKIFEISL